MYEVTVIKEGRAWDVTQGHGSCLVLTGPWVLAPVQKSNKIESAIIVSDTDQWNRER